MTICDHCADPGRCCKAIEINNGEWPRVETSLEAMVFLASIEPGHRFRNREVYPDAPRLGLPFMPLYRRPDNRWVLWCPNLGHDGRCTDYENRPALCHAYKPSCDFHCAHENQIPLAAALMPIAADCIGCNPVWPNFEPAQRRLLEHVGKLLEGTNDVDHSR